jgi:hypothetical protein
MCWAGHGARMKREKYINVCQKPKTDVPTLELQALTGV